MFLQQQEVWVSCCCRDWIHLKRKSRHLTSSLTTLHPPTSNHWALQHRRNDTQHTCCRSFWMYASVCSFLSNLLHRLSNRTTEKIQFSLHRVRVCFHISLVDKYLKPHCNIFMSNTQYGGAGEEKMGLYSLHILVWTVTISPTTGKLKEEIQNMCLITSKSIFNNNVPMYDTFNCACSTYTTLSMVCRIQTDCLLTVSKHKTGPTNVRSAASLFFFVLFGV